MQRNIISFSIYYSLQNYIQKMNWNFHTHIFLFQNREIHFLIAGVTSTILLKTINIHLWRNKFDCVNVEHKKYALNDFLAVRNVSILLMILRTLNSIEKHIFELVKSEINSPYEWILLLHSFLIFPQLYFQWNEYKDGTSKLSFKNH